MPAASSSCYHCLFHRIFILGSAATAFHCPFHCPFHCLFHYIFLRLFCTGLSSCFSCSSSFLLRGCIRPFRFNRCQPLLRSLELLLEVFDISLACLILDLSQLVLGILENSLSLLYSFSASATFFSARFLRSAPDLI